MAYSSDSFHFSFDAFPSAQIYPPQEFYGSQGSATRTYGCERPSFWRLMDPRVSTNFQLAHEGPLYAMLAVVLCFARFVLGCSWATVVLALLLGATMGLVGAALHASFHIRGFAFERYLWYQVWG